jgi:hypothetical protein
MKTGQLLSDYLFSRNTVYLYVGTLLGDACQPAGGWCMSSRTWARLMMDMDVDTVMIDHPAYDDTLEGAYIDGMDGDIMLRIRTPYGWYAEQLLAPVPIITAQAVQDWLDAIR